MRFGCGGDDSKKFVDQLFGAYMAYAERHKLKTELILSDDGHMSAKITGPKVGQLFKHESGKHCVQRIPENDRKGRKQTSIVVVGVLPVPKETVYVAIPEPELKVETCKGSGPGGQHKNKTESAVRMTHIPTGITCYINGRDQHYNKIMAMRILKARVADYLKAQADAEYASMRKEQLGNGGRTDKVRTYNFFEQRAADHRYNTKTSNIKALMKGQFELLFPETK